MDDIENGSIGTLEQLRDALESMHNNYEEYEWTWAEDILQQRLGKTVARITADDVIELTMKWKTAVVELDNLLVRDTQKEFAATAQIGYGLDGKEEVKHCDFEAVRGKFEKNIFVSEIEKHIIGKSKLGDELIHRMEKLRSHPQ